MTTRIYVTLTLLATAHLCPGADMLLLNSGAKIAGTVTSYSDMTFHVQTATGSKLNEPLVTVRSIEFADSATPVSLDVRPTGKVEAKILQFENSKFAVATRDGEIEKIPAASVVSMQWGERPPTPVRPPPVRRASTTISPADPEPQAASGGPSNIDFVRGNKQINLEDHLVRGKVTVVDFYADWCGPCRALSPKLEAMAAKNPSIALVKINIIDWKSPVAKQFEITSIPRVQVYDPSDKLVGTSVGVNPTEIAAYVKQAQSR